MESPAKKRSIFGFTGLWRSSTAPPADTDATSKSTVASAAESPPLSRVESGNASAPESPVKRASDTQLASRKILGRPQGPSSKLSQSFTAADFERPSTTIPKSASFSESIGTAPRRRPGDNPYKASAYAPATISETPTWQRTTNFSGTASTPRNIFRSSAMYQRPGIPSFSPRVPPNTTKHSFPPTTPGKPPRSMGADVSGRGLASATSSELFEMRISSPPRHLTGEMLTKELRDHPKDPSRPGSIYADEYLAHLCPPDLDEQQRRQFFCILDLRRLKYSADEVFTKKDWKINVLNFAKEYEKNRSLIMLRYGLYEFKTVRASEAVKKEWKQKHGIPSSDDESEPAPVVKASAVGSKRKAEDDLKSTDTALTTSSSNANKRARAPEATAAPAKNKRKANDEPDENQPAKLPKPAATPQKAPSATKSVFESIVNKGPSTTPAKPPAKSLFAAAPKLPNGTGGRSVFEVSSKPPAASTNIFGHLSDASKGSPNDDADAESEADSAEGEEGDEGESEARDASTSEEPGSASDDAPTPKFGDKIPSTVNGTSTTSSEAGESSHGRSLFDRITRGSDGQPVRQLPSQQGASPFAVSPDKERSASPAKDLPALAPTNNTWNTSTPIKFTSGSFFAHPSAPKSTIDFGASTAKKPEAEAPAPPAQNMFAGLKKPEETAAKLDAPKPAASLFSAKPTESTATPTLFGGAGAGATSGSSILFGAGAPPFGQTKDKEEKEEKEAPKLNAFQSSTLFGSQTKTDTPAQPATSLFSKPASAEMATQPAASLFGQAASQPLFKAARATSTTEEPAAKKLFGSDKPATSLFATGASGAAAPAATESKPLFGGATSEPKALGAAEPKPLSGAANTLEPKPLFGVTGTTATESKPLFGATSATSAAAPESKPLFGSSAAAPESRSIFGASSAPEVKPISGAAPVTSTAAPERKPIFGAVSTPQAAQEAKPLFGATPASQAEAPKTNLFGSAAASAAPGHIFSFGSQPSASQPPASQPGGTGSIFGTGGSASFTFSAGGSDGTINNPFAMQGSSSAPSSFNFGSGGNDSSQTSTFQFGAAPTISFGGDGSSQPTQPNTSFGGGSIFNFGGSSQTNGSMFSQKPPSTTSMFGSTLAPGGGTSTGTNSPFNFGGASSLATTPATGTPEPAAEPEDGKGTKADGDEEPQEQISLTEGGPGEEDETVVHEVRAKAVKLAIGGDSEEDESSSARDKKNPWKTQGVGPLRILKHKATGAVRMLLRAEPRGHVALNKLILPNFTYKVEPAGSKYVKLTAASDDGKALETWMLQVKTPDAAKALAESLEANKTANAKS